MRPHIAPDWQALFEQNGLRSFDDFWNVQAEWFEEPNQRRGGWSGVARCELKRPDGGVVRMFLKRQENHVTKTLLHPIRGMATLAREFKNFLRFERSGVAGARLVYFGQRRVAGKLRAVLATEELAGFRSLEDWMRVWRKEGWPRLGERRALITSVAASVRRMHEERLRHNCLWSKHVFLKFADGIPSARGTVEVRIIDLEKMKRTWSSSNAARKDLCTLHRDCPGWSTTDRARFLKAYLDLKKLSQGRRLWDAVAERSQRKRHQARALTGQ